MDESQIIVVGGGPVGLSVALHLGRAGLSVRVFEQGDVMHQEPRATTLHAATLDLLDDLGVYETIEPMGIKCPVVRYWDRKNGELVAEFDHAVLGGETRHPWALQCEQDKLSRVLFAMLERMPNVQVHRNCKVVSCGQSDDTVEIGAEDAGGELTYYRADFVVAADGARSTVRALSQVDFEGFTYPERFVILSTPFDFMAHEGYAYRNYLFHPDEWGALFKIAWAGPPGIWRLVLPASPETPLEDLRGVEMAQALLQRFLPRKEPYEIPFHNAYTVDQRVAATFRKGRVLLAGDAAHLNNPLGAMGLNSGIHDAVNLAENLIRVAHGVEGEGALDRYARQRRYVAVNHVQTVSAAQKQALEQKDPAKLESYYNELRRTAADPDAAKSFLMVASLIDSLREAAQVS